MPVRMLNFITERPPSPSSRGGKIADTEEWQDFAMSLGAGLKPQEYVSISFPPDSAAWKRVKNPIGAFVRLASMKVKELNLPYDVYVKNRVVYVVGRGLLD